MAEYDIFLSYKSDDRSWVEKLQRSLKARGVHVWLDKDQIRPGDIFPNALEDGIQSTGCVGLVVTPASMASNWVREEYYRALKLANEGKLQLIPILLHDAEIPGFLQSRQYVDFRKISDFDQAVDRLVWPGITGKKVVFYSVSTFSDLTATEVHNSGSWHRLSRVGHDIGLSIPSPQFEFRALYMLSIELGVDTHLLTDRPKWTFECDKRIVFVLNLFDNDDTLTSDPTKLRHLDGGIPSLIHFLARVERMGTGTSNEAVVILYHNSNALDVPHSEIDRETVSALQDYYTLYRDTPSDDQLRTDLSRIWVAAQRDLLCGKPRSPLIREDDPGGRLKG